MRRAWAILCLISIVLAGCEEDKSALALKNTGGVVSREDNRTTVKYASMKDTDSKVKRLNFQLAGTFIRISHMNFTDCDVSDRGIETMTRITDLEVLHISECRNISNGAMKLLAQNPKLTDLVVVHTRVNDDGFGALASLTQLESLEISGVAEKTLSHIGKLRRLERLSLVDSEINEAGARSLGRLGNLRVLDFYRCEMRENVEYQVRRALPQTRITIHRTSK